MLAARSDGRHLRSKSRRFDLQFTLRFSQLAAFFIDARAQRSTVRSTISLSRTDSTRLVVSKYTKELPFAFGRR